MADSEIEEQAQEIERLKQQLDLFDHRLDNIDSMVSAVAERIMSQMVTLEIKCPHCGKNIDIGIVGNQRPTR